MPNDKEQSLSLPEQLWVECNAMLKHALACGLKIPPALAQRLAGAVERKAGNGNPNQLIPAATTVQDLFWIHAQLAAVVAPATPRSIHATEPSAEVGWRGLGSVRLLRQMMRVAGVCLVGFIATAAYTHSISDSMLHAGGWQLVFLELHFLTAAGLGASFFALFKAKGYVNDSTFDPRYEPTYWVRFVLGLIAGAILANFIEIDLSQAVGPDFEKATVALLGGFSADAVYRLLNRLVDAVSSVVSGDAKATLAAETQALKNRMAEEAGHERLALASDLVRLREQLTSGAAPGQLNQALTQLIDTLVPGATPKEEKDGQ